MVGYERIQDALARMVEDFGPTITDDPARVRSVLSDLLGDGSISLREDIDAVVQAAEAGIPSAVSANASRSTLMADDVDMLIARVTERGVTPPRAEAAVRLWSSSLGMTELPEGGAPVTELPAEVAALTPPTELPGEDQPGRGDRRRLVLISAAAVLVFVIAAVAFASRGGDKERAATTADSPVKQASFDSNTTTTTSTTTTTTTTTSTTVIAPPAGEGPGAPSGQPGPIVPAPAPQPEPEPEPQPQPQPQPAPETTTTTTTPPPLPAAPAAYSDSYVDYAQFYPCGSSYCHGNINIPLSYIAGGTWNRVTYDGAYNNHGEGYVSGDALVFVPHHQGSWYDRVYFTVWDDSYGRSASGYFDITIYCNEAYAAYDPCVNYL